MTFLRDKDRSGVTNYLCFRTMLCVFSCVGSGLSTAFLHSVCQSPLFLFKTKIKVISQLIEFLMSFFLSGCLNEYPRSSIPPLHNDASHAQRQNHSAYKDSDDEYSSCNTALYRCTSTFTCLFTFCSSIWKLKYFMPCLPPFLPLIIFIYMFDLPAFFGCHTWNLC